MAFVSMRQSVSFSALLVGFAFGAAQAGEMHKSAQATAAAASMDKEALIEEALRAAPPQIAATAKVMDWDGTVLREGDGTYTCMPTPPDLRPASTGPMCLDAEWMAFGDAWKNKNMDYKPQEVGIAYMLGGDAGASNTDPFATQPTADNEWVVEGNHLMVLLPDPALLESVTADSTTEGPYVMWQGTPFAHIMIPVGPRPDQPVAMGTGEEPPEQQ